MNQVRDNIVTINENYTQINQRVDSLELKAVSTEEQIITINGDVEELTTRIQSAEIKLEPTNILLAVNEQIGDDGEIYTTKFVLDKDGVHISNGGLDVSNNNGEKVLYADTSGNLTLKGTITATSGSIGGWNISGGGITKDTGTYYIGLMSSVSSSNNDVLVIRKNNNGSYTYPFYLHNDGYLYCSNLNAQGTISSSTISGSNITGGTINIGNGNFVVNNRGVITQKNTGSDSEMKLSNGKIELNYKGEYVGNIGANQYSEDSSIKGISFMLESEGDYMGWSYRENYNDDYYTLIMSYNKVSMGNLTAGDLNIGCSINMRNYSLKNISAQNGYTGWTGEIPIVTRIENKSDGGITWYTSSITVSNGIITSAPRTQELSIAKISYDEYENEDIIYDIPRKYMGDAEEIEHNIDFNYK